jgi:hypothetical protein
MTLWEWPHLSTCRENSALLNTLMKENSKRLSKKFGIVFVNQAGYVVGPFSKVYDFLKMHKNIKRFYMRNEIIPSLDITIYTKPKNFFSFEDTENF